MLLPAGLRFSPHPPVSVLRYGYGINNSGFFLTHGSRTSLFYFAPHHGFIATRICQSGWYPLAPGFHSRLPLPYVSPQFCHTAVQNLHLLSIGYDSRPRLRPRLPPRQISFLPWKPWIFGLEIPTSISFRHSLFHAVHSSLHFCFLPHAMLLYRSLRILSFGGTFQPRTFSAQGLSTSELLRYSLNEWLLLSQHPGCLRDPTSFST